MDNLGDCKIVIEFSAMQNFSIFFAWKLLFIFAFFSYFCREILLKYVYQLIQSNHQSVACGRYSGYGEGARGAARDSPSCWDADCG
jgi:hypothetical protein